MSKNDKRQGGGETASKDDFASMLAAYDATENVRLQPGDKVRGRVFHISKENVFVEINRTQEGVIPRAEVIDDAGKQTIAIGDNIEAFVVSVSEGILLSRKLGRDSGSVEMLEQARHNRIPVEGTVTAVNKGGIEVSIGTVRGFCPLGQVDINFVEDPQTLIGQTLSFMVKEVKERGRSVVLSRRALLESERAEKAEKLLSKLEVGQRLTGTVTRVAAFGAFVDLGGIDGLIPIGELSHSRVSKTEDVVNTGDKVEVEVRSIEEDKKKPGSKRISLSRKATLGSPWEEHGGAIFVGATLQGRVVKLETFGAFIELFPGVQGLIHISELSYKRVRHPSDILKINETVPVRVLNIDADARRIGLSLREAGSEAKPDASGGAAELSIGSQVEGKVERHESYGVFVSLAGGGSGLVPAAETGTDRGTDLSRVFPMGSTLSLEVIGKDDRGRLRLSKTAREKREEQSVLQEYRKTADTAGFGGKLGDLLKNRK